MLWFSLWVTLWLRPALATFVIKTDKTSYSASDTLTVSWSDDGNTPSIDNYATANVLLCAYTSDSKIDCPITLTPENGADITDKTELSFDLSSYSSEAGAGQYVVQFTGISSKSKSTYVGVYGTSWITLTGFTGATTLRSGNIPAGYSSGDAGSGDLPGASDSIPASYSNLESSWMTPYEYQHGLTRYAPFQPTPNSTVTLPMTITRRHSTSSVSMFLSNIKTPLPLTTATPSPSVTLTRHQNYASTQSRAGTGRPATRVTPTAVVRAKRWAD